MKQVSVDPVEEGSIKITGQDPSLSMRVGSMLPIRKYKGSFSLVPGAAKIAEFGDGTLAITAAKYGSGKAIYVGTMLSRSFDQNPKIEVREFFLNIAESAGVNAPMLVDAGKDAEPNLESSLLESEGGAKVAVFINHDSKARRVRARLQRLSGQGAKDLLTNSVLKLEAHGADSTADFSLPAGDVRVLMIGG